MVRGQILCSARRFGGSWLQLRMIEQNKIRHENDDNNGRPPGGSLLSETAITDHLRFFGDETDITKFKLSSSGSLHLVEIVSDYSATHQLFRFGASFTSRGKIVGVCYGVVFKIKCFSTPRPKRSLFYDWCDGADEEVGELAQSILASGRYEDLFVTGDAMAIDAFEFLPGTPVQKQQLAIQSIAKPLKRHFTRLRRALILVEPARAFEGATNGHDNHEAQVFLRAQHTMTEVCLGLGISNRLNPRAPMQDILIIPKQPATAARNQLDLAIRVGG